MVLNMGPLDWESSALITKPVIYNQLSEYSDSFLNNVLCGFRKVHSTQHALLKLLQSPQQVLDNGVFISTILMDLSKAHDCISHNLLIAKLDCYGVDKASIRLLLDYLTRRKARTKVGSIFISWCDINTGVPQGSILGLQRIRRYLSDDKAGSLANTFIDSQFNVEIKTIKKSVKFITEPRKKFTMILINHMMNCLN